MKDAYNRYLRLPEPNQVRVLYAVLSNCAIKGTEVSPTWRKLFDALAQSANLVDGPATENEPPEAGHPAWLGRLDDFRTRCGGGGAANGTVNAEDLAVAFG